MSFPFNKRLDESEMRIDKVLNEFRFKAVKLDISLPEVMATEIVLLRQKIKELQKELLQSQPQVV